MLRTSSETRPRCDDILFCGWSRPVCRAQLQRCSRSTLRGVAVSRRVVKTNTSTSLFCFVFVRGIGGTPSLGAACLKVAQ